MNLFKTRSTDYFFAKHFNLNVWQSSKYMRLSNLLLFGKTDANKIDLI